MCLTHCAYAYDDVRSHARKLTFRSSLTVARQRSVLRPYYFLCVLASYPPLWVSNSRPVPFLFVELFNGELVLPLPVALERF